MAKYILIEENDIFHDLAIIFLDQYYYKKKYIRYNSFMKAMKDKFNNKKCQYITYKFRIDSFLMGYKYKTEVKDITLYIPDKWIKNSRQSYIIKLREEEPPVYNL